MKTKIIFIFLVFSCCFLACRKDSINNSGVLTAYAKGKSLYLRGETKAALDIFVNIIAENPEYSLAHFMIGRIYFFDSDYKTAADYFEKSLKIKPDNITYLKWLSKTFLASDRAVTALPLVMQAVNLSPEDPSLMLLAGKCLKELENYSEAILFYNKAFLFEIELSYSHLDLADIYGRFGLADNFNSQMQRAAILADGYYERY